MRLLVEDDFKDTGWDTANQNIAALVEGMINTQQTVFKKYNITQNMHIVHLMAQISHECGEGQHLTESLNYQPSALLKQWPRHFTPALAQQYGRTTAHPADQQMIGQIAYGGRNGNAPSPSLDGYNYRGRGLIQTTGKSGYALIQSLTGLDLINNPELINDPQYCLECAVADFVSNSGILTYCENDNLLAVSALVNVGHLVSDPNSVIGYQDREAQLRLWKQQYGI